MQLLFGLDIGDYHILPKNERQKNFWATWASKVGKIKTQNPQKQPERQSCYILSRLLLYRVGPGLGHRVWSLDLTGRGVDFGLKAYATVPRREVWCRVVNLKST